MSDRFCTPHIAVIAASLAVVLGGCASTDGGADVGHYTVRVSQTPMFRYGPAQNFGPDFNLSQGQHVFMLKRDFGYSLVETDEQQKGYVATDDLSPAPPPKKAETPGIPRGVSPRYGAMPPLPASGTRRPGVSSANNHVVESGPLFGPGDLPPLPERGGPENSKPAETSKPDEKKPGFRYPKPKPGFRVNVPNPGAGAAPETKP